MMDSIELWERYKKYLNVNPDLGLMVDISRMNFPEDYFDGMEPRIQKAFRDMDALESGTIANPDERRMVGHYWLRAPDLGPKPEIREEIKDTLHSIKNFAQKVHSGRMKAPNNRFFSRLLIIGIGGSALGPQFVSRALGTSKDSMKPFFFDNTDPDGIDLILEEMGESLSETLILVVSKSGGTIETRNGMVEAKAVYESKSLPFEKHAVAITEPGSDLDHLAQNEKWWQGFPCGIG